MPSVDGAVTSNQTLIKWLPKLISVSQLLDATEDSKALKQQEGSTDATVCVAYQTKTDVKWKEQVQSFAGRTLEEAFALENLEWCQDVSRRQLGLRVLRKGEDPDVAQLAERIHTRVSGSAFDKTKFALCLMTEDETTWNVPRYIVVGLEWLRDALPHSGVAKAILATTAGADEAQTA
jgi:hypothetical protein